MMYPVNIDLCSESFLKSFLRFIFSTNTADLSEATNTWFEVYSIRPSLISRLKNANKKYKHWVIGLCVPAKKAVKFHEIHKSDMRLIFNQTHYDRFHLGYFKTIENITSSAMCIHTHTHIHLK